MSALQQNSNTTLWLQEGYFDPTVWLTYQTAKKGLYSVHMINRTIFYHHLGFVKFKLLTIEEVKRPILHQDTKFRKDGQTVEEISRFFSKIQNF